MTDFTHLHVHSHYSLLDGLAKIRPLLERTKELGMTALALTDHGAMYGTIDFYQQALELGIKPIIGLETYLAPGGHMLKRGKIDANPRHLTLLAMNTHGYHNLIQLSTTAHLHGYYYRPRIDYELLAKHAAGLIVLSGCLNSDLSRAILERRQDEVERLVRWHLEVFGREHYYLEVQSHPALAEQRIVNEALVELSRRWRVSLVATADSHYLQPEDAEAHDVLLCVQTGKTVQDKDRLCMLGEDFSLQSPQAIAAAWQEHPAAIENTQKIAEMCTVDIAFGANHLPRFPLPADRTPDAELRALCDRALPERYTAEQLPAAEHRLNLELGVIAKTGFASYFLIVADFVNEAKRRGILMGPGRGSAAGSIVSYLTNITGLDPLRYNLLFERFLNPDRVSMPDIDLDFADNRRDEVIAYVREKYGHEHVAQIITFGTMAARAAVRDAGRALGYPYSFCDRIAKSVPPVMNFTAALLESTELKGHYDEDPQARRLIDTARKLEGVYRHASTHAAGVVITDELLTNYLPLQLTSSSGKARDTVVTQYAMHEVEALGLLKMDFLGLKNLTIIQDALQRIQESHRQKIDLEKLPLDDAATFKLLQAGKTTGVFQLESAGMKRWLKELQPTEFEDILSILALYRPGPMESMPDFIAAKHGRRHITYLHASLEPILAKTYGVIVTQDQVLQIARDFAGFTYAEADILRKAVGKKIKKLLDEQREKFILGAVVHAGVDRTGAQQVWDFIEPFARYGFNRAHAACYAMIAYQTAHLKAHYPAEFMAALLTSDEGNVERQAIEVAEALSLNLPVLPPDINESDYHFSVVRDNAGREAIRFGLGAIKNVGKNVAEVIIAERKERGLYTDIYDAFRRVSSRDFNRKSVESLARAGAFDRLAERRAVLENVDKLLAFNRALHRDIDTGQRGLFGGLPAPRVTLDAAPAASKEERLGWEKELLGLYVSEHPLQEFHQELLQAATPIAELPQPGSPGAPTRVRVGGIIARPNKIVTKKGQPMLFVQIEDMTATVEVVVFPALLTTTEQLWTEGAKLVIEGKLGDRDGQIKVLADAVWRLNAETLAHMAAQPLRAHTDWREARRVVIQLKPNVDRSALDTLRRVLAKWHVTAADALPVVLVTHTGTKTSTLATRFRLPRELAVQEALTNIVGQAAIDLQ
ncbi:MAG: DNA polymerase III subunit alpha [Candidatus Andersenbacteria bacterium]|nr:DNA polymerase III subunit alpha [Candidatus Andersenbacteria bacterium]